MPDMPDFPKAATSCSGCSRPSELTGFQHLGPEVLELGDGVSAMRCEIQERHLASNGYLHAASVVALADTTAGYGCMANLPEGAEGFTTLELKSNHVSTLLTGAMGPAGRLSHGGRTTQVWDVTVSGKETGKTVALFRCTQFLLYPRVERASLVSDPMADIHYFILKLRAIRDFKPEPLEPEDLAAILEAARWTGSSKNRQDWSFLVITDPDRLQDLASHGDFTQPVRDSVATIVIVQEPGGNMFDVGRAAQNIMLAAKAVGVASCPITLHREPHRPEPS